MLYTLMLGAPVRSGDHEFGSLSRIIVNNGVANQFAVNPKGLFSGSERIVPISDVAQATSEGVELNITDIEWKAYAAFNIDQLVVSDRASAPDSFLSSPRIDTNQEALDVPTAEAPSQDRSTTAMSVALDSNTQVGNAGTLAGMVVDTGIPQQLLIGNGATIPFTQVGVLDEKQIVLGDIPPRLDGATPPGLLGDTPQRLDGTTPAGSLGDRPPDSGGSNRPGSRG